MIYPFDCQVAAPEIAMIKASVPKMTGEIIDRAIQVG